MQQEGLNRFAGKRRIFCKGKQGLDAFLLEIGRMMAETIMPACAFARRQVY
jgi:hypothetical protein